MPVIGKRRRTWIGLDAVAARRGERWMRFSAWNLPLLVKFDALVRVRADPDRRGCLGGAEVRQSDHPGAAVQRGVSPGLPLSIPRRWIASAVSSSSGATTSNICCADRRTDRRVGRVEYFQASQLNPFASRKRKFVHQPSSLGGGAASRYCSPGAASRGHAGTRRARDRAGAASQSSPRTPCSCRPAARTQEVRVQPVPAFVPAPPATVRAEVPEPDIFCGAPSAGSAGACRARDRAAGDDRATTAPVAATAPPPPFDGPPRPLRTGSRRASGPHERPARPQQVVQARAAPTAHCCSAPPPPPPPRPIEPAPEDQSRLPMAQRLVSAALRRPLGANGAAPGAAAAAIRATRQRDRICQAARAVSPRT